MHMQSSWKVLSRASRDGASDGEKQDDKLLEDSRTSSVSHGERRNVCGAAQMLLRLLFGGGTGGGDFNIACSMEQGKHKGSSGTSGEEDWMSNKKVGGVSSLLQQRISYHVY